MTVPLYIFDLDGTLALIEHRRHFVEGPTKDWRGFFAACVDDVPNTPVIQTLQALDASGAEVWIWSGRSDEVIGQTSTWLISHRCWCTNLQMREQDDHRDDTALKKAWLDAMKPADRGRLVAVFEDRSRVVAMWRAAGVTCFQVSAGDF